MNRGNCHGIPRAAADPFRTNWLPRRTIRRDVAREDAQYNDDKKGRDLPIALVPPLLIGEPPGFFALPSGTGSLSNGVSQGPSQKGLNMEQKAAVLMDLKRRLKSDRCIIERDGENVV